MVTIGFDPVSYFVLEDASAVNVTVSILNGTLARNVEVFMSTLSAGTATGEYLSCTQSSCMAMTNVFLQLRKTAKSP